MITIATPFSAGAVGGNDTLNLLNLYPEQEATIFNATILLELYNVMVMILVKS